MILLQHDIEIIKEVSSLAVNSITKDQLAKIEKRLPEYYRTKSKIGHSHSQSSYALQTLTMLDDSPLSRMKQCLANIQTKFGAVSTAYYKIEKMKLDLKKWQKAKPDEYTELKIRQKQSDIASIQDSMGNSLRQIGMFQDFYDSIRISNKIPENWDEHDYEKQEIANMIRKSFRLGIQNISANTMPSMAVVEYWEQLGIHPQTGEAFIRNYLEQVKRMITDGKAPDIRVMYEFLDAMANQFKDSYKFALDRIGLTEIGSKEFMM